LTLIRDMGSVGTGPVDLRSDTVTRPDAGMRAAMAAAEVGDDVYGEDPTVLALQEQVAGLLGKEAALFCVSGSLANLLATTSLVRPGQELLCEARAHIARAELGAHAAFGGLTMRTWSDSLGRVDLGALAEMADPDAGPHLVSTAAISVENTHNFAGGTVQPIERLRDLRTWADRGGLGLHCDGARLWNAAAATGLTPSELAAPFDMVSVCLSKGLGAPIGSLIAGPAEAIREARTLRKRLGAGWRQAGVLAAAGQYALAHNTSRLVGTHAAARLLASACAEALPGCVAVQAVETNIVVIDLGGQAAPSAVVRAAADAGVLVSAIGASLIRLVTHIDVDEAGTARAAEVLRQVLSDAVAA
jgi:threonine aldolase